ncbi:hypothetical protein [Deinococcus kurensis]|uniref:hypothetical protein n=1 Tax=Deinococcus kurensis TaxID=2662757 RepID=UPI0012D30B00|nr:hypothetical protein [Deinococcus kurensis]
MAHPLTLTPDLDAIHARLADDDAHVLTAPDLTDALIGVVSDRGQARALYSTRRIVDALVGYGLGYDAAVEHFSAHVEVLSLGPGTPVFLEDL